jgi:ABC-2 type transport system permease protein
MLTVNQLFFRRLGSNWKFQYGVLRTVVDWVTALYFFIPALSIAIYHYYKWWDTTPLWMDRVPFTLIAIVLSLYASTGAVRLFILDADQLFLVQRSVYYRSLMKLGILYTFIMEFVLSAVILLILAPILLNRYAITPVELIMLYIFISCFRINISQISQRVFNRFSGWRYTSLWLGLIIVPAILFILYLELLISMPFLLALACVISVTSAVILAKNRLSVKGTFFHDVEYEFKQRMKFAALLFRGLSVKKQRVRRSHPLLFPNSNLLFRDRSPANGLVEMCVKSFFRSWAEFKVYLQFVFIGAAVLMLPFMPMWSKWVVWIALAFILCQRLKTFWGEMMSSDFVRMFAWKDTDRLQAAGKAIFLMAVPGFIFVSIVFGFSSFSLLGAVILIPLGGVVAYGISHMLAPW